MSLTLGVIRAYRALQPFLYLPYQFETGTRSCFRLIHSPLYNSLLSKTHKIILYFGLFFTLTFSTLRVLWLVSHWQSFGQYHVDQLAIYGALIVWMIIISSILHTISWFTPEIIYLVNQRLILSDMLCKSLGNLKDHKENIRELATFTFPIGSLMVFATGEFFSPFALPYTPLQLILDSNSIQVRVLAGVTYCLLTISSGWVIISGILLAVAVGEGVQYLCFHFIPEYFCNQTKCVQQFSSCYANFRHCQILVILLTHIFHFTIFVCLNMAVMLASCTAYLCVTMYNKLPIGFYMICPAVVIFYLLLVNFITHLLNASNMSGKRFLIFWKFFRRDIFIRKMLKSCPQIGVKVDFLGLIVTKTGLELSCDFVHTTINLLLLST